MVDSLTHQRPQAVMATAQVLFHRFYCKKSFVRFSVKVSKSFVSVTLIKPVFDFMSGTNEYLCLCLQRVAASCVWLAGKLEESPRRSKHIIIVFHRMECRRENVPIEHLDVLSKVILYSLFILNIF